MTEFIRSLHAGLVAAFESEEYQTWCQMVVDEFQQAHESALTALRERAKEKGFALLSTPKSFVFAPMQDDNLFTPDQLREMSEEERKAMESSIQTFQQELLHILRQVPSQQWTLSEKSVR